MNRKLVLVPSRAGGSTAVEKATFGIGIGDVQPAGNDLTPHYMVRAPGTLVDCVGNAKTAPTSDPLYIDICRSRDQGDNWESVFRNGGVADEYKLIIPAGSTHQHLQSTFADDMTDLRKDDWLRIDLLAGSAEDAQDIEVVLRWAAASGGE